MLAARDDAVKAAGHMLKAYSVAEGMGVGSTKDLEEALRARATARAKRLETVYALNMAVASLSRLLGTDLENIASAPSSNEQRPEEGRPR